MSFIDVTRQNITEIPSQNFTSGGRLYFTLPKTGLLSSLYLSLEGVMTVTHGTGTAVLSERAPWNLIKRIRLIANSGTSIYDVSGFGTYLINNTLRQGYAPDKNPYDRGINADVFSAAAAAGANTWKLGLKIPIAINERDPLGLILLQNDSTQMVLEIDFNNEYGANDVIAPIVVTGNDTAAFVGKVNLTMEYFTVPQDTKQYPPLTVIHQWLEQQDSLTAAGAVTKTLQRGNTYMRLMHSLTLGNKLETTAVDKLRILYNGAEVPYTINKLSQLLVQRNRYGMDLPKGTFLHDWYYSNGIVGLGNSRDFINSANVTEFQSEVNINSGATVTAGTSFLTTITEQLIKIA
jgi:hypothetical protein